jgi:carboxypeptidase C (cathepsin A)
MLQVASILYVDSPTGVGLSYCELAYEDYASSDSDAVYYLNVFMRKFLSKYEKFSSLDFYIAGARGT